MPTNKKLLSTFNNDTVLLGRTQRHLMLRDGGDPDRDMSRIHVSEVAKSDWCPRSTFYRISGVKVEIEENPEIALQAAYDEGKSIHKKWQGWWWQMGVLQGVFVCRVCSHRWEDTSPEECPACESRLLRYAEVPLASKKHLLVGHADGRIDDDLAEIKSIGTGTLRFEHPRLLNRYTVEVGGRKVVDLERLWRAIRHPFPSHLRQGNLYLHLSGLKRMIFIYDCKWAAKFPKEFRIRYQPDLVSDLLDACLDIRYGLESEKAPARPDWAKRDHRTCKSCIYKEHCYGAPEDRKSPSVRPGKGQTERTRSTVSSAAQVRDPSGSSGSDRPRRRRPDDTVREAHSVGRLLERASRRR